MSFSNRGSRIWYCLVQVVNYEESKPNCTGGVLVRQMEKSQNPETMEAIAQFIKDEPVSDFECREFPLF